MEWKPNKNGRIAVPSGSTADGNQACDMLEPLAGASASDAHFRQVVEAIADAVVIHRHGRIIYANPSAIKIIGAGRLHDLIGQPVLDFVAPEDRERILESISDVMQTGQSSDIVSYVGISGDGSRRHVETIAVRVMSDDGQATLNVCRDVSARIQTERELKAYEERFRIFAEHSSEAIIAIADRRIVVANRSAAELLEADEPGELIGRELLDFCHWTMKDRALQDCAAIERGNSVLSQAEGRMHTLKRRDINVEWTSIPFTISGVPACYMIIRDVTERLENEERHRFLASHDMLTGLPNRVEFQQCLKAILSEAKAGRKQFAIHYLDLDYFKTINDTLGHHVGDKLLQSVARRLKLAIRSTDVVARLGGDEFAVLQQDVEQEDAPTALAKKLQNAVELPYAIGSELLHTSTTIGIAVFPDHGHDPDELLRRADLALYRAKGRGRNAVSFYSDDLDVEVRERDILISQLIAAEAKGEFDVFFQPIANLCTGEIEAVEALLRWNHPERGLLPADAFIHAIEVSREAQRISAWVLRKACGYAKQWLEENQNALRVAVNLSMPLLQRPDLVDLVRSSLEENDLDPSQLELELTERMVITAGAPGVERKLAELHDLGVRLALDDFGTGFSSLSLLKDLPIDRIKIDRSFVAGFGTNADDTAIVRAVTNLGRSMNKRVTAEGVENLETLELLRSEGCHEIQGFHLARPMPATSIAAFLERFRGNDAYSRRTDSPTPALVTS